MKSKKPTNQLEEFDILSSIWILSCNDEISIMTYEGIIYRLGLNENFDVKKLISSRGDLFRLKVPKSRLATWKKEMLIGKRIPSFIYNISDKSERANIINSLSIEDAFRNQFRAEDNAPKAPIEILDWGLQHINRLRQTKIDLKENRLRKFSTYVVPTLSLLIAALTVFFSYQNQVQQNLTQLRLKQFEVTFKIKQENYSRFMQGVYDTFENTRSDIPNSRNNLFRNINNLEITYFNIEPFLNNVQRKDIWRTYVKFTTMCIDFEKYNEISSTLGSRNDAQYQKVESRYLDSLLIYKDYFHVKLYPVLFKD